MRNMKVSRKLITSFIFVIIAAMIIGIVAIFGLSAMNEADKGLFYDNYIPSLIASDISQKIIEQRVNTQNLVIYDVETDSAEFKESEDALIASENDMAELIQLFSEYEVGAENQAAFEALSLAYSNEWLPMLEKVHSLGKNNQTQAAKEALGIMLGVADKMIGLANELKNVNLNESVDKIENNSNLFITMAAIEISVLVLAIVVALCLAFYVSGLISKPLAGLTDFMNKAGTSGDIILTREDSEIINRYSQNKDETGLCIASTLNFVKHITDITENLGKVANGDLTVRISPLSEKDIMGSTMQKMVSNLNDMFSKIALSAKQVNSGSKQIADGSGVLSKGSIVQSDAVNKLSEFISDIEGKTRSNAEMADKATNLADTIKGNAEKGSRQMNEMMNAVKDINQASQNISKVIKVIDDIAFQTNILALNAAVEAARAGQHGKGFAVVAEEVRNLASKSAESAKNTAGLISNSMEKAALGERIANETSASLNDIVDGINESNKIIAEIARLSEQQSEGVAQINQGIAQVADVVAQNSSTAQESAAASEQMSGQADMLEELIVQFKLNH